jgi:hypothetical protein
MLEIDGTIVKEYTLDSGANPSVLKLGTLSYPVSIQKLFVDKTYADYVLAKNPVTVEVACQGTPVGKPKFTYSGVILNKWGLTNVKADSVIGERVWKAFWLLAFIGLKMIYDSTEVSDVQERDSKIQ